jgi:hypothetical protein
MTQLTIFSAPKPFTDPHIAMVQRNAIRSWLAMGPEVEVLLVGQEEGLSQAAKDLEVTLLPNVQRNEYGTPLVNSIFQLAREASHSPVLAFANTDMLFFPETVEIVNNVAASHSDFVLLGRRFDLDINAPIDFSAGWDAHLHKEISRHGRLHTMGGSDYFIFPRNLYGSIPKFAIGRAGWDNWMIYHAISRNWLAVDATPSLPVVHQNHDYAHLTDAPTHQRVPETFSNAELGGGMRNMYMLLDLQYRLVNGKVRRAPWSLPRALRGIERRLQPEQMTGHGPRWLLLRGIRKLRRALSGAG